MTEVKQIIFGNHSRKGWGGHKDSNGNPSKILFVRGGIQPANLFGTDQRISSVMEIANIYPPGTRWHSGKEMEADELCSEKSIEQIVAWTQAGYELSPQLLESARSLGIEYLSFLALFNLEQNK